jgi:hypothetical protein
MNGAGSAALPCAKGRRIAGRSCVVLPNLLIIGAPKCGTTSLHNYLRVHPEIFMSQVKELNYFLRDDWREQRDWYESHFAGANGHAVRGESSPQYAQHPFRWRTADRVAEVVPDARLIYVVRDPIERLRSHYLERRQGGDDRTWEEWTANWPDPADRLIASSLYATQMKVYLEHFAADDILVVDHHDLKADRIPTLRRIFEWLRVDPSFDSPVFREEHNNRRGKGSPRMPESVWKNIVFPLSEKVPRRMRAPIAKPVARLLLKPFDEPPAIEGRLREELLALFGPETEWLRSHTGQRFASWSV